MLKLDQINIKNFSKQAIKKFRTNINNWKLKAIDEENKIILEDDKFIIIKSMCKCRR